MQAWEGGEKSRKVSFMPLTLRDSGSLWKRAMCEVLKHIFSLSSSRGFLEESSERGRTGHLGRLNLLEQHEVWASFPKIET